MTMDFGLVLEKSPASEVFAFWAVLIALFTWAVVHHRRTEAAQSQARNSAETEPPPTRDYLTTEGYDFSAMIGSGSVDPSMLRIYDASTLPHPKETIERSFMSAIRNEGRAGDLQWIPTYYLMLRYLSYFQPGVGSSPAGPGDWLSSNTVEIGDFASATLPEKLNLHQKQRLASMASEFLTHRVDPERERLIRSDQERYANFMASELGDSWIQHMNKIEGMAGEILRERRVAKKAGHPRIPNEQ